MKNILMSIKPKWVEKIASGEKTVEVRKTVPKCGTPFKVYIYCTNEKPLYRVKVFTVYADGVPIEHSHYIKQNGKVVGEFVCDRIFDISFDNVYGYIGAFDYADMGLKSPELQEYAKGKTVYGLHISDLKIYDKPKELSEFRKPCDAFMDCWSCPRHKMIDLSCRGIIERPPQSWCYVEEL